MSNIFPRSVMSVSRSEFGADNPDAKADRLQLNIKEGTLPRDLHGHVFIVGPAGSVDSTAIAPNLVIPSTNGTTLLYNGDGMIYRLDLDQPETGAYLATRLIKPPCYYADATTQVLPEFQGSPTSPDLRFESIGIARLGQLGMRNQLNTAFLPMKFANEDRERLLVTWDAGRPYEIDPATLETVTPVGWNAEWQPVTQIARLPWQPPTPFETVQTSAHPIFDPHVNGGQVITLNLGRSLANTFSQLVPLAYMFQEFLEFLRDGFKQRFNRSTVPETEKFEATRKIPAPTSFKDQLLTLLAILFQFVNGIIHFFTGNFVDLVIWDGQGQLQKWRVRHQGRPLKITQSTHQLGVTEDYIVIIDTAFKISVEELLPPLKKSTSQRLEKWLRRLLDHPQLPDNHIYILRRRDLTADVSVVAAQKIVLPLEAAHFLVDYKNPDDQITLHFSHVCAWDAAECVSEFDFTIDGQPPINPTKLSLERLYGIIYGPTDISRLGSCTLQVNANDIQVVRPQSLDTVMDTNLTWGPAIYAFQGGANYGPADQLKDIYWSCIGCWSELLKPHIEALYQDYPYREMAPDLIRSITREGRPSNLLRLHITPLDQAKADEGRVQIADTYQFDPKITVGSPQFVPARPNPEKPSEQTAGGYIVCIVHYGDGSEDTRGNEIWIFNSTNLAAGPICKLWHPEMDFGFTVHSTWLEKAAPRTAPYHIPIDEDYRTVIDHPAQLPEVKDLFENWVFKQRQPEKGKTEKNL